MIDRAIEGLEEDLLGHEDFVQRLLRMRPVDCPSTQSEPDTGDIAVTPDNREEIGNLTFGGTVATPLGLVNITAGSLAAESPE